MTNSSPERRAFFASPLTSALRPGRHDHAERVLKIRAIDLLLVIPGLAFSDDPETLFLHQLRKAEHLRELGSVRFRHREFLAKAFAFIPSRASACFKICRWNIAIFCFFAAALWTAFLISSIFNFLFQCR